MAARPSVSISPLPHNRMLLADHRRFHAVPVRREYQSIAMQVRSDQQGRTANAVDAHRLAGAAQIVHVQRAVILPRIAVKTFSAALAHAVRMQNIATVTQ